MQILVVVAMIPARYLKSEVEKVSIATALDYGLPGPEECGNSLRFWRIYIARHSERETG